MCVDCSQLIKAIDAYILKQKDDLEDALDQEGYLEASESTDAAQRFEDELADVMNADTQNVADQLEKADSLEDFMAETWATIQEASALAEDIRDVFENGLTELIPKLVEAYLQETDMYLVADVISQRTTDWIANWSYSLGQMMKLTSHTGLENILTDAVGNGKSVYEAADEIMDKGIRSNYSRARSTALTEMLTAHSVARNEGLMQSPAVEDKEWRHSGGRRNRVRKNHVAMDGTVVPKDKKFELRGADGVMYHPEYPRDPILPPSERVNCHCLHRGIVNSDILGLSLDERRKLQQQAIDADDRRWAEELDDKNRQKAGIEPAGKSANSWFPNGNRGIMEITGTAKSNKLRAEPNAVIDAIFKKGGVSRTIYDEEGKAVIRVDNNDHGNPRNHPYGNGCAHYSWAMYDDDGNFIDWSRNMSLTAKMRRCCADILEDTHVEAIKGADNMLYTYEEFVEMMDVEFSEVVFDYNGVRYIISMSIKKNPDKGRWICIGTDGYEVYANNAEEMLDAVVIDGEKLRNLLDKIE